MLAAGAARQNLPGNITGGSVSKLKLLCVILFICMQRFDDALLLPGERVDKCGIGNYFDRSAFVRKRQKTDTYIIRVALHIYPN
jgi:hypothetical protein